MKLFPVLIGLLFVTQTNAHPGKLKSISVSYFGEMITHPGLKINADFQLKSWQKTKKKNGSPKLISKSLSLSPSLGLFYHRRYQTGLFFLPEICFQRQKQDGKFIEVGAGAGYLKTLIPNSFEVNDNEVQKSSAGHSYFASSVFFSFGKNLQPEKEIPISYFIKPQLLLGVPGFPSATGYFGLELGFKYDL